MKNKWRFIYHTKWIITIFLMISIIMLYLSIIDDDRHLSFKTNVTIYIVTATYKRPEQRATLIKTCVEFTYSALTNSSLDVIWIVIEDSNKKSELVSQVLEECELSSIHLIAETQKQFKNINGDKIYSRGVSQRNAALSWIKYKLKNHLNSRNFLKIIFYIADDDNVYHPDILSEISKTKELSTWPVGLVADSTWEGCVTSPENRSKIIDMKSNWKTQRVFPIDMAGFAVNAWRLLDYPKAKFSDDKKLLGYMEGWLLEQLGFVNWTEMEPLQGCQHILSWHTNYKYIKPWELRIGNDKQHIIDTINALDEAI